MKEIIIPSMNGMSDYIQMIGETRKESNKKRIVQTINRLIQMTTEECFVRDESRSFYYKDDINNYFLFFLTDSLVDFTDYFFRWYRINFNEEFDELKPHLNYLVKNIHLFLAHLGNVHYFPIVRIDPNCVAYLNGIYNTHTKQFIEKSRVPSNLYTATFKPDIFIPIKRETLHEKEDIIKFIQH